MFGLEDFSTFIKPYATRNERLYGLGTLESPFVGGWCVEGRAVAYNGEAKKWLKEHNFIYYGRRWLRTDDRSE